MSNLLPVKDDTFQKEVLESTIPVLVDFSAVWCGPCKALAPTLETLAQEYNGKVKFVAVNIDDARATAMKFNIMSVPTVLVFKGGTVVGQLLGNRPRTDIVSMIDKAIG